MIEKERINMIINIERLEEMLRANEEDFSIKIINHQTNIVLGNISLKQFCALVIAANNTNEKLIHF